MPNLTSVGVTSGVPTSGTGTVSTIDALMALVGGLTDAAATQGSTGTLSAKLRTATAQLDALSSYLNGIEGLILSLDGKTPALGQALAGASVPVVLTAAQLASLMAPVLAAGSAIVGKVTTDQTTPGTTDRVTANVDKIGGSAVALGQALAAASVPVVLTAAQLASLMAPVLAAGSALVGKVGIDQTTPGTTNAVVADLKSGVIYDTAGNALTVKYAAIAASSSGNNNLVAAVTSKKIRVLAYNFISNGTVNAKFQSDFAGTPVDKTGLKYCVANMGICAPYCKDGWFETGSGKTLDLNLSAAVAVGGEIVYCEVP